MIKREHYNAQSNIGVGVYFRGKRYTQLLHNYGSKARRRDPPRCVVDLHVHPL